MRALTAVLAAATLLALASSPAASAASRSVPFGFMGVSFDPSIVPASRLDGEMALMAARGVESIRTAFNWTAAQPYGSPAEVPADQTGRFRLADGVPTDFSDYDRVVATAAAHGMPVQPVVLWAPGWAAKPGTIEPRDPATYARFLAALVGRYGPRGTLWSERPELPRTPIRRWQVWNEPNLGEYWQSQPWATSYVSLLRVASRAIRRSDPGAKVVLAGLVNFSWTNLERIYDAGGRGAFDVAAIHPYTAKVSNVLRIVKLVRKVMRRNGDRRGAISVTELSWPSSGRRTSIRRGFETTEAGQAKLLAAAYSQLAQARRTYGVDSAYWYDWVSREVSPKEPFDYAGLRKLVGTEIVSKPALTAYARTARGLEGCTKRPIATRCR